MFEGRSVEKTAFSTASRGLCGSVPAGVLRASGVSSLPSPAFSEGDWEAMPGQAEPFFLTRPFLPGLPAGIPLQLATQCL